MITIEKIRFWLLREPYENFNFFAHMSSNGMMNRVRPLAAPEQETFGGVVGWLLKIARSIREPRASFIEFLACNSSEATFAPARWNALVASLKNVGECAYGGANDGANDNDGPASLSPTEKAA